MVTDRVVWNLDEDQATQIRSANHGAVAFAYHPLPDPSPDEISQDQHEANWHEQMREQADQAGYELVPKAVDASAGLEALRRAVEENDPPKTFLSPPEFEGVLPTHSHEWRELMFRPGMSAAMMYVLYPVIQAAVMDAYPDQDSLVRDLRTWWELTFPERDAMVKMMSWIEEQVGQPDSQLPADLQQELARVYGSYENHEPEE